jgi:hypothetical protein
MQTDQATGQAGVSTGKARLYLTQAVGYLDKRRPVLIAVGGLSGTRRTELACELAAHIGHCPGAVNLPTDTERKAKASAVDFAPVARDAVYDRMFVRAADLLAAGRSVILDGTFLDAKQHRTAEEIAAPIGVGFCGLWLTAPEPVMIKRVMSRRGDASDADAAVVRAQVEAAKAGSRDQHWITVDAGGTKDMTKAAACAALDGVLGKRTVRP